MDGGANHPHAFPSQSNNDEMKRFENEAAGTNCARINAEALAKAVYALDTASDLVNELRRTYADFAEAYLCALECGNEPCSPQTASEHLFTLRAMARALEQAADEEGGQPQEPREPMDGEASAIGALKEAARELLELARAEREKLQGQTPQATGTGQQQDEGARK